MPKNEDLFSRLEAQLKEYSKLPVGPELGKAGNAADYISQRIQKPNGDFVNQYRNAGVVKGGGAKVEWEQVAQAANGPAARVGMTLSRLGAGHLARLVLYGGLSSPTAEKPQGGFAPSQVELFDPTAMKWCAEAEKGEVRGRAPAPRAGHAAAPLGRHLLIVFGGRTELGLSAELAALAQHRCKPTELDGPASCLLWSRPRLGSTSSPSARAHHAMVAIGSSLVMFGGEVIAHHHTHMRTAPEYLPPSRANVSRLPNLAGAHALRRARGAARSHGEGQQTRSLAHTGHLLPRLVRQRLCQLDPPIARASRAHGRPQREALRSSRDLDVVSTGIAQGLSHVPPHPAKLASWLSAALADLASLAPSHDERGPPFFLGNAQQVAQRLARATGAPGHLPEPRKREPRAAQPRQFAADVREHDRGKSA